MDVIIPLLGDVNGCKAIAYEIGFQGKVLGLRWTARKGGRGGPSDPGSRNRRSSA